MPVFPSGFIATKKYGESAEAIMDRIKVGKASDIPPGSMVKASVNGLDIMIANIDGEYCAVDDTCTHAGASLSEGALDGCTVTCGWHGAQFECKTGKMSKFPVKIRDLTSYAVKVESGDVFVEM